MKIACWPLPLGTAILILATIHSAFALTVWQGYIPFCVPYWADCISISHSGRHGIAYFVFKGGMIPATVLLGFFWHLCQAWLSQLGIRQAGLTGIAACASLALLVYTLALGHSGDTFRLLRRFGVVLFFGLSFVNFALLARALAKTPLRQPAHLLSRACAVILGIALFSLGLDAALGDHYDRLENAFEWWLTLLLIALLAWVGWLWRRTGFALKAS